MIFKDIDRLLTIEKYGSFSKAADELYISRSALTQQMKQLEKELGFSIFDRDHKGATLTREGSYFIEEMQRIRTNYDEAIHQCRQNQQTIRDTILIGMMPNLKSPFLTQICKEFCIRYPLVEIRFQDYFLRDYLVRFQNREFDISAEYFFNYIHTIKGLEMHKMFTATHKLQVVPEHPLANKSVIHFEDLRGHKLIMYRRGMTKSEDQLRDYIQQHEPEITIIDIESYDSSLFTRCMLDDAVLLSYSVYDQSFPQFVHIPAGWNIPVELGFCCHKNCRPIINDFLSVADEVLMNYHFTNTTSGGSNLCHL